MSEQDFQAFKNHWNDQPGLARVIAITSKRRTKLGVRMEEPEFNQNWHEIIDIIAASLFCCGYNSRGWKATFDWIIANDDNYIKVLEGKYSEPKPVLKTDPLKAKFMQDNPNFPALNKEVTA